MSIIIKDGALIRLSISKPISSAPTVEQICDKEVIQNDRNNRILDDDNRNLFISCWACAYIGRNNNVRGDSDE